ncbi:MAG: NUDIX hydrolase [Luminiphilus sp.]|nr:NUDIX hydrolase [Luminiphilus sp.]
MATEADSTEAAAERSEYRAPGLPAVRPREASTLIIVRQDQEPRVLMGKRAAGHRFMPNKFVFPGGRLDLIDQRLRVPGDLSPPVIKRLNKKTRRDVSGNKLRGLALAAIRETYEETGLIIGRQTAVRLRSSHSVWQSYFDHGVEPPLDRMDFIARAVTPAYRSRRFDTRFFMVHDEFIHTDPDEMGRASGELLDLHWLTLGETRDLDLPTITRWVIDMVAERLLFRRDAQLDKPAPYVRFINGKADIQTL